jgi:hypothetical protein
VGAKQLSVDTQIQDQDQVAVDHSIKTLAINRKKFSAFETEFALLCV